MALSKAPTALKAQQLPQFSWSLMGVQPSTSHQLKDSGRARDVAPERGAVGAAVAGSASPAVAGDIRSPRSMSSQTVPISVPSSSTQIAHSPESSPSPTVRVAVR